MATDEIRVEEGRVSSALALLDAKTLLFDVERSFCFVINAFYLGKKRADRLAFLGGILCGDNSG